MASNDKEEEEEEEEEVEEEGVVISEGIGAETEDLSSRFFFFWLLTAFWGDGEDVLFVFSVLRPVFFLLLELLLELFCSCGFLEFTFALFAAVFLFCWEAVK